RSAWTTSSDGSAERTAPWLVQCSPRFSDFGRTTGRGAPLGERTTRGVALAVLEDGHREDLFVPVRPALVSPHRAQETRLEDPGLGRPIGVVAEPPAILFLKGAVRIDHV